MIRFEEMKLDENSPIYMQIIDFIRGGLAAGTIVYGDELPSRRVLSAILGINPNTVQKAYAMLEAGELIHVIADCHIYDRHIPLVRKMLDNPSYPAPKFRMDPSITDFYHFTPESFHLEGYQWAPFDEKIPVAI